MRHHAPAPSSHDPFRAVPAIELDPDFDDFGDLAHHVEGLASHLRPGPSQAEDDDIGAGW